MKPNVPTRVRIHILVICGLIVFQSSLLPRNWEALTNDPINIPREITDAIIIPIFPEKNDPPFTGAIVVTEPEFAATVVSFVLLDDILVTINFLLFITWLRF